MPPLPILALLAVGYYFDAALGQNGLTLKVMGKLRYVTIIYLVTAALSVILSLLFIPKYGALGSAVAITVTLILFNLLKQGGLLLGTGRSILDPHYRRMYLSIIVATVMLVILQAVLPSMILGFVLAGVVSLAVMRWNRHLIDVRNTFPELMKIPAVRWLLE